MSGAVRREARRRAREAHIAELEQNIGLSPTTNGSSGLPRVTVERKPNGEWMMGDRWTSRGLDSRGFDYYEVTGMTRRSCIRKARARLRAIVEKDLYGSTEVTL